MTCGVVYFAPRHSSVHGIMLLARDYDTTSCYKLAINTSPPSSTVGSVTPRFHPLLLHISTVNHLLPRAGRELLKPVQPANRVDKWSIIEILLRFAATAVCVCFALLLCKFGAIHVPIYTITSGASVWHVGGSGSLNPLHNLSSTGITLY